MSEYVIQIRSSEQRLIKSYEVNDDSPVRIDVPGCREQIVLTDEETFNEVVALYDQYGTELDFSYDAGTTTLSCAGAHIQEWDVG